MNVEEAAQLHRETLRMLEKNVSLMKINTIAKMRRALNANTQYCPIRMFLLWVLENCDSNENKYNR